MYMCARGIDFASIYHFGIECLNFSNSVVFFVFHCIVIHVYATFVVFRRYVRDSVAAILMGVLLFVLPSQPPAFLCADQQINCKKSTSYEGMYL